MLYFNGIFPFYPNYACAVSNHKRKISARKKINTLPLFTAKSIKGKRNDSLAVRKETSFVRKCEVFKITGI